MIRDYTKDPDAHLDYGHDWTPWLDGDTLADSTWLITPTTLSPLLPAATSHSATGATVWLSGGLTGTRYRVTNRVTTAAGRIEDRSFLVTIAER